jgi:hypothetical protein
MAGVRASRIWQAVSEQFQADAIRVPALPVIEGVLELEPQSGGPQVGANGKGNGLGFCLGDLNK